MFFKITLKSICLIALFSVLSSCSSQLDNSASTSISNSIILSEELTTSLLITDTENIEQVSYNSGDSFNISLTAYNNTDETIEGYQPTSGSRFWGFISKESNLSLAELRSDSDVFYSETGLHLQALEPDEYAANSSETYELSFPDDFHISSTEKALTLEAGTYTVYGLLYFSQVGESKLLKQLSLIIE
jgi:hypothetical protein